jgi:spore photoproduct lyase
MKRNKPDGLDIATNTNDILTAINDHVTFDNIKKPNQTHETYTTYDISCNEDFALHSKHHDWKTIFDFFKYHDKAMGTLATKIVPDHFLDYNPNGKIRIRFSLMPQHLSSVLEPNTARISERVCAIDEFIEAGYDVHINFSPVIMYRGWEADYKKLFELVDTYVDNKDKVLAEVIFLTHNQKLHERNVAENREYENYLWCEEIQEPKQSQFGGNNVRYRRDYKAKWIDRWVKLHDKYIPWNKIRYIF